MNPGVLWVVKTFGPTKFVFGVIAVILSITLAFGAATMYLAVATSKDKENLVNCSGVSWDTPYQVKGVDYMERFGEFVKAMTDRKDQKIRDPYLFVRAVKDTINLWRDALTSAAFGDVRANKAVTGDRNADKEAREKALAFCCVQLRKFQNENEVGAPAPVVPEVPERPKVDPGPGSPDEPWDPKLASFQNSTSKRFNDEQMDNARVIRQVAVDNGLGKRAVVVAYATAFQESGVINVNFGDRDSLGLFQQRAAWGPRADRMDPAKSAQMFFTGGRQGQRGLTDIRGWERMSVARAAQAVQVSAFPNAYAKWEDDANALLTAIGGMGATGKMTPPPPAVEKLAKTKRPVFDPSVPLESYCQALEKFERNTGGGTVDLGSDATGQPKNLGGGPVPVNFDRQGNPRTVEQAVAWMRSNAPGGAPGERVYNRCERYMNLAYGLGGGYATANAHWNAPGPRSRTGVPPRGALVFWRTSNAAGHVALSLGNGIVASTDYNPKTHRYQAGVIGIGPIEDIDRWAGGASGRLGWRAPNFKVGSEGVAA